MDYKITAPLRIMGEIDLPASKSISNRVLLLNALSSQPGKITNLAQCDDTMVVVEALGHPEAAEVNVGPAGTAMRFLTAYYALRQGRTVLLDGNERMRKRPIGILVDALRWLGAQIEYAYQEGFPPLKITGSTLRGGQLTMSGDVSSQFISAILMIGSVIGGLRLHLTGEIASRPYIDMTLGLMAQYGVNAHWEGSIIDVPKGQYKSPDINIENDWSAASYWYALQALLPESRITLRGLSLNSLQGDSRIAELSLTSRAAGYTKPRGRTSSPQAAFCLRNMAERCPTTAMRSQSCRGWDGKRPTSLFPMLLVRLRLRWIRTCSAWRTALVLRMQRMCCTRRNSSCRTFRRRNGPSHITG